MAWKYTFLEVANMVDSAFLRSEWKHGLGHFTLSL